MKTADSQSVKEDLLLKMLPADLLNKIGKKLNYTSLFNFSLIKKSSFAILTQQLVDRATERFLIREVFFGHSIRNNPYTINWANSVEACIHDQSLSLIIKTFATDNKTTKQDNYNVIIPTELALRGREIDYIQIRKHFSIMMTDIGLYAIQYPPIEPRYNSLDSWKSTVEESLYDQSFIRQLSIGFLPDDIIFWPPEVDINQPEAGNEICDVFSPYNYGQSIKDLCMYAFFWGDQQFKKLQVTFSDITQSLINMRITCITKSGYDGERHYLTVDGYDHSRYTMESLIMSVESRKLNSESPSVAVKIDRKKEVYCSGTKEKQHSLAFNMHLRMSQPSESEELPEVYKQYEKALISRHGDSIYRAFVPEISV